MKPDLARSIQSAKVQYFNITWAEKYEINSPIISQYYFVYLDHRVLPASKLSCKRMMPGYYWATTRKRWMNRGSWYPYNYINTKVILTGSQYSSFFHFTSNPNVLSHIWTCMWSTHRHGPIYYLLTHTNSSKLSHSILPVSKSKVLSIILGHKEVKSYFNTIYQGINFFPKDF